MRVFIKFKNYVNRYRITLFFLLLFKLVVKLFLVLILTHTVGINTPEGDIQQKLLQISHSKSHVGQDAAAARAPLARDQICLESSCKNY